MEFLKERVYTSLNADELRAGDKVIVANSLYYLKKQVEEDDVTDEIMYIATDTNDKRFRVDRSGEFALAYLVERKENCTNCDCCVCAERNWATGLGNERIYCCPRYKPKTEMPELISLGNGQYAEKKHYRPFRDVDELIKVWGEKIKSFCDEIPPIVKPLIWVKDKESGDIELISTFGRGEVFAREYTDLNYLFDEYTFLDGSVCGVEE